MNAIEKLALKFSKFPGIGPRQAKRFVYFLLGQSPDLLRELAQDIEEIKNSIRVCTSCFRYHNTAGELCNICRDHTRSDNVLIVVEKDIDIDNIEKSDVHEGYYFVLGGSLPFMEKEPEKVIRIKELIQRISNNKKEIKEVILALSLTPEGENTSEYITLTLADLRKQFDFKISHLGRGLSTGTEIEYSDKETIKEAFKNRN
jgi:recombination protein RecR